MVIQSCSKYVIRYFRALAVLLLGLLPCVVEGHMGARYEPNDGRVIHGLGQYVHYYYTALENWHYVDEYLDSVGQIPLLYSVYAYLDPAAEPYNLVNVNAILEDSGNSYIPMIGIALQRVERWQEGTISVPVSAILAGEWDDRIMLLAEQIKAIGTPVFVRPGFEFGINNHGAHAASDMGPDQFKAIWIRIYNLFANAGVRNVAWVWNTVNPWMFNYILWYPGDGYVDWWGVNFFTSAQMSQSDPFIIEASRHQKPVMICEASPIHDGGTANAANWAGWFQLFFEKIRAFDHIKGFVYISDPWDREGWWQEWSDSRINQSIAAPQIRSGYAQEMADSRYIHLQEYLDNPAEIIGAAGDGNNESNDFNSATSSGGGCFISFSASILMRSKFP